MSGPKRPSTKEVFLEGLKRDGSPFEYFIFKYRVWLCLAFFLVALAAGIMLTPRIPRGERLPSGVQAAHALGLALYSYAQDNGGSYPTGKSSTEVFQKLMDGGYITDPAIFYIPMSGKTPATGKTLKPENVCWDVTSGTRQDDPSDVILLFSTGTQMNYTLGAKVRVPDSSPYGSDGLVAFYTNNSAAFISAENGEAVVHREGYGYNPKGQHYVQLTP